MRKKKPEEHVNHERWLISYADFITLLFAFFVVMFAVSQVDSKKVGRFTESFSEAVGLELTRGGAGILTGTGDVVETPPPQKTPSTTELPEDLEKLRTALALRAKNEGLPELKVIRRKNELVLRLSDNVLFPSGDDSVRDPAFKVLTVIADEVRKHPVELRVEGHTDNIPIKTARFRSNWDLSTARATAVIAFLIEDGELPAEHLAAAGYGEYRPVAVNTTVEGRAQNRRVDLVISMPVIDPT